MANTYTGFIGCQFPSEVKSIEETINNWYMTNGMENFHFSAQGNSRQLFFTEVSHWMMRLIAKHQDLWCNNETYHDIIDIMPRVHVLTYCIASSDMINRVIIDLYNMINDHKEEL